LLCRILLSERSQFLYKINTLGEMVEDLNQDFCVAATEIVNGVPIESDAVVKRVLHDPLPETLRSARMHSPLKSFLMVPPKTSLNHFRQPSHTDGCFKPS
jgi:hypothetical protein